MIIKAWLLVVFPLSAAFLQADVVTATVGPNSCTSSSGLYVSCFVENGSESAFAAANPGVNLSQDLYYSPSDSKGGDASTSAFVDYHARAIFPKLPDITGNDTLRVTFSLFTFTYHDGSISPITLSVDGRAVTVSPAESTITPVEIDVAIGGARSFILGTTFSTSTHGITTGTDYLVYEVSNANVIVYQPRFALQNGETVPLAIVPLAVNPAPEPGTLPVNLGAISMLLAWSYRKRSCIIDSTSK